MGETSKAWTGDTVLAQARALAVALDPPRESTYRSMSPARWQQAVDLGGELLTAYVVHRLYDARGRGRHQHNTEVHTALDAAPPVHVVAALALMLTVGRLLPNRSAP